MRVVERCPRIHEISALTTEISWVFLGLSGCLEGMDLRVDLRPGGRTQESSPKALIARTRHRDQRREHLRSRSRLADPRRDQSIQVNRAVAILPASVFGCDFASDS